MEIIKFRHSISKNDEVSVSAAQLMIETAARQIWRKTEH